MQNHVEGFPRGTKYWECVGQRQGILGMRDASTFSSRHWTIQAWIMLPVSFEYNTQMKIHETLHPNSDKPLPIHANARLDFVSWNCLSHCLSSYICIIFDSLLLWIAKADDFFRGITNFSTRIHQMALKLNLTKYVQCGWMYDSRADKNMLYCPGRRICNALTERKKDNVNKYRKWVCVFTCQCWDFILKIAIIWSWGDRHICHISATDIFFFIFSCKSCSITLCVPIQTAYKNTT